MDATWDARRRTGTRAGRWAARLVLGSGLVIGLFAGCGRGTETAERSPTAAATAKAESRTVAASFHPLAHFAERIAGGRVAVVCPCPPDADPALWKPTRPDLQRFQDAALVLVNGAGFEAWTAAAALPLGRVVVTSQPFEAEWLTLPTVEHSHGPGGAHTHSGTDGHTWMDPVLARRQATEILEAFRRRWPGDAAAFQAGFDGLAAEFTSLEAALSEVSPAVRRSVVFTSHPAYQYLARRLAWTTVPLSLPPDEAPTAGEWDAVRRATAAAGTGPRVMLFETRPLPETRERLRSGHGIAAVVFETCESPSPDGNYFQRMRRNVESLRAAVGPAPP